MDKYESLPDQIWTTRVSRVNAEKRLINKESFFQAINVYYSCLTIIFSILALVNKDEKLSLLTVFMTISLLTVILYLNGQRYIDRAREYRKNYTELQKLEFDLRSVNDDVEMIKKIYTKYCDLIIMKRFMEVQANIGKIDGKMSGLFIIGMCVGDCF